MNLATLLHVRPANEADHGFVISRWRGEARPFVVLAVRHGTSAVLCSRERETTLYGFANVAEGALCFAYVLPELRGRGLARRLVEAAFGSYPDIVRCARAWPFASNRYVHNTKKAA